MSVVVLDSSGASLYLVCLDNNLYISGFDHLDRDQGRAVIRKNQIGLLADRVYDYLIHENTTSVSIPSYPIDRRRFAGGILIMPYNRDPKLQAIIMSGPRGGSRQPPLLISENDFLWRLREAIILMQLSQK